VGLDSSLNLYVMHRRALVDYASSITGSRALAEDLVQEAWLRFAEASKGRLLEDATGYLFRIVRNLAIDGHRKNLRESQLFIAEEFEGATEAHADQAPSQEAALVSRQDYARVMEALAELPERTRIALEMHRFGGAKLREIAAFLDISVSLAHALVVDGVDHCRRRLDRS